MHCVLTLLLVQSFYFLNSCSILLLMKSLFIPFFFEAFRLTTTNKHIFYNLDLFYACLVVGNPYSKPCHFLTGCP